MFKDWKLNIFPTTVVGSWLRPKILMEAFTLFNQGRISMEMLQHHMDNAVRSVIEKQVSGGVDIPTDGEQRRENWMSILAETLSGFRITSMKELVGEGLEAKKALNKVMMPLSYSPPIAIGKVERHKPMAVDALRFAMTITDKPLKVTLPSPYLVAWNAWDSKLSRKAYPTPEDLGWDIAKMLREEIIALRDAGAFFVQLDDPSLGCDLLEPAWGEPLRIVQGHKKRILEEELETATEMINTAIKGVGGVKVGLHICRGNWRAPDEVMAKGSYEKLLPLILNVKVHQLVLEFATPRAGSIDVFKDHPVEKELGLGVIDTKNDSVEQPEQIVRKVEQALNYFDADKIYLNPDCGFATDRSMPVADEDIALKKLNSMSEAARILRKKHS